MRQIITHFTDNDLYTFSCQYYIMQKYPRAEVEYTFIDRNKTCYPKGFDKLLQEQIDYMAGVTITDQEIDFMKQTEQGQKTLLFRFYSQLKAHRLCVFPLPSRRLYLLYKQRSF